MAVNASVHLQPRNQALELVSPSICINSVAPAMVESLFSGAFLGVELVKGVADL